jgi:hypothetical protein
VALALCGTRPCRKCGTTEPSLPVGLALIKKRRQTGKVGGHPSGFVPREAVDDGAAARLVFAIEPADGLDLRVVDTITAIRLLRDRFLALVIEITGFSVRPDFDFCLKEFKYDGRHCSSGYSRSGSSGRT